MILQGATRLFALQTTVHANAFHPLIQVQFEIDGFYPKRRRIILIN